VRRLKGAEMPVENDGKGPQIVCTGVSLVMGGNPILDDITLTIAAGTIHCIIGPNGGGKSSFVNTLLGRMRHTGKVAMNWAGADRTIGYVPQVIAIDKAMPLTVRDFITLCVQNRPAVLGMKKRLAKTVDAVLADVQMSGKEKYLFSELSGGERQRVLFAQALIPTPRLLVLDEPTSSIDREGAAVFADRVRALAADGTTVIWVHHDFALVRELAHTVSCFRGRLVFSGPPSEVMSESRLYEIFAPSAGA
jgi:zinc transport system ATP-binding protein